MKNLMVGVLLVLASSAGAVTVHRSFRNGYPAGAQGVTVRQQPKAAVLTAPKMAQGGTKVVTNRVVLTKEQAEKLLKNKKRFKEVKKPNGRAAKELFDLAPEPKTFVPVEGADHNDLIGVLGLYEYKKLLLKMANNKESK